MIVFYEKIMPWETESLEPYGRPCGRGIRQSHRARSPAPAIGQERRAAHEGMALSQTIPGHADGRRHRAFGVHSVHAGHARLPWAIWSITVLGPTKAKRSASISVSCSSLQPLLGRRNRHSFLLRDQPWANASSRTCARRSTITSRALAPNSLKSPEPAKSCRA